MLPFDPNAYAAELTSFSSELDVRVVEVIEHGGASHPIHCLRTPSAPVVLVVAGIHGDELAGVHAVPRALRRALGDPERAGGPAHGSRYDGEGCDVNRDFDELHTPEARLVRRIVEEVRPDLILALHEGPRAGFFTIVTSAGRADVGEAIAAALGHVGRTAE